MSLKQLEGKAYREEMRADITTLSGDLVGKAVKWLETTDENGKNCIYLDIVIAPDNKTLTQKFSTYHYAKTIESFKKLNLDGFVGLVNSGKYYRFKQTSFGMGYPRWIPDEEIKEKLK